MTGLRAEIAHASRGCADNEDGFVGIGLAHGSGRGRSNEASAGALPPEIRENTMSKLISRSLAAQRAHGPADRVHAAARQQPLTGSNSERAGCCSGTPMGYVAVSPGAALPRAP